MICYRYRHWSDISVKELLYNEIYFCSADESNDPYEGKKFIKFKRNKSKWKKVFQDDNAFPELYLYRNLFDKVVNFFCSRKEWTLQEILLLKEIDFSFLREDLKEIGIFVDILKELKEYFCKSFNSLEKYFVSFSKNCDNTAMWSHYADKHKGFCLIFNCYDNKLHQDPLNRKKELHVKTIIDSFPHSPFANSPVAEYFDLCDIKYLYKLKYFDGFLPFVSNFQKNKEAIRETYLQKSKAWINEEELRILLEFEGKYYIESKWSKTQRLFHYDFNQLVGIILGYRMEQEVREQIIEIIKEKIETHYKEFGFCIFEAELSLKYQKVDLEPIMIINQNAKLIGKNNIEFDELYKNWTNNYGVKL